MAWSGRAVLFSCAGVGTELADGLAGGGLVATLAVMQLPPAKPPPDVSGRPDLTARLELALAAAREAGRLTLGYFSRGGLAVELKADDSPVTVADRRGRTAAAVASAPRFPTTPSWEKSFPNGRDEWFSLDSRPDRWHQVLYPRRAALRDPGGGRVPAAQRRGRDCHSRARRMRLCRGRSGSLARVAVAGRAVGPRLPIARLADSLFCTSDDTHWRGCGRQPALERLQAGGAALAHLGRLLRLLCWSPPAGRN